MLYLDTSGFLKLVVDEEHSAALRRALSGQTPWSSVLLDVEAHRVGRRLGVDGHKMAEALEAVSLISPSESTFATARTVGPDTLRTLDAVHLATALELGAALEAVVVYDRRLAGGCEEAGIAVVTPGRPARWWRS